MHPHTVSVLHFDTRASTVKCIKSISIHYQHQTQRLLACINRVRQETPAPTTWNPPNHHHSSTQKTRLSNQLAAKASFTTTALKSLSTVTRKLDINTYKSTGIKVAHTTLLHCTNAPQTLKQRPEQKYIITSINEELGQLHTSENIANSLPPNTPAKKKPYTIKYINVRLITTNYKHVSKTKQINLTYTYILKTSTLQKHNAEPPPIQNHHSPQAYQSNINMALEELASTLLTSAAAQPSLKARNKLTYNTNYHCLNPHKPTNSKLYVHSLHHTSNLTINYNKLLLYVIGYTNRQPQTKLIIQANIRNKLLPYNTLQPVSSVTTYTLKKTTNIQTTPHQSHQPKYILSQPLAPIYITSKRNHSQSTKQITSLKCLRNHAILITQTHNETTETAHPKQINNLVTQWLKEGLNAHNQNLKLAKPTTSIKSTNHALSTRNSLYTPYVKQHDFPTHTATQLKPTTNYQPLTSQQIINNNQAYVKYTAMQQAYHLRNTKVESPSTSHTCCSVTQATNQTLTNTCHHIQLQHIRLLCNITTALQPQPNLNISHINISPFAYTTQRKIGKAIKHNCNSFQRSTNTACVTQSLTTKATHNNTVLLYVANINTQPHNAKQSFRIHTAKHKEVHNTSQINRHLKINSNTYHTYHKENRIHSKINTAQQYCMLQLHTNLYVHVVSYNIIKTYHLMHNQAHLQILSSYSKSFITSLKWPNNLQFHAIPKLNAQLHEISIAIQPPSVNVKLKERIFHRSNIPTTLSNMQCKIPNPINKPIIKCTKPNLLILSAKYTCLLAPPQISLRHKYYKATPATHLPTSTHNYTHANLIQTRAQEPNQTQLKACIYTADTYHIKSADHRHGKILKKVNSTQAPPYIAYSTQRKPALYMQSDIRLKTRPKSYTLQIIYQTYHSNKHQPNPQNIHHYYPTNYNITIPAQTIHPSCKLNTILRKPYAGTQSNTGSHTTHKSKSPRKARSHHSSTIVTSKPIHQQLVTNSLSVEVLLSPTSLTYPKHHPHAIAKPATTYQQLRFKTLVEPPLPETSINLSTIAYHQHPDARKRKNITIHNRPQQHPNPNAVTPNKQIHKTLKPTQIQNQHRTLYWINILQHSYPCQYSTLRTHSNHSTRSCNPQTPNRNSKQNYHNPN
eukprot:gene3470-2421_t